MTAIDFVHEQLTPSAKKFPAFKAGDNITVNYKIVEGTKERIQSFKGDVIKRQGTGATATFTVRKMSDGVGVERAVTAAARAERDVDVDAEGNPSLSGRHGSGRPGGRSPGSPARRTTAPT